MDSRYISWLVLLRACRALRSLVEQSKQDIVSMITHVGRIEDSRRLSFLKQFSLNQLILEQMFEGALPEIVLLGEPQANDSRSRRIRNQIVPGCRELGRIVVAAQCMDSSESMGRDLCHLSQSDYLLLRREAQRMINDFSKSLPASAPLSPWGISRDTRVDRFKLNVEVGLLAWVDVRFAGLDTVFSSTLEQQLRLYSEDLVAKSHIQIITEGENQASAGADNFDSQLVLDHLQAAQRLLADKLPALVECVLAIAGMYDAISFQRH